MMADIVEKLVDILDGEITKIEKNKKQLQRFRDDAKRYTDNDYTDEIDRDIFLFADAFSSNDKINITIQKDVSGEAIVVLENNLFIIEITRDKYLRKTAKYLWMDSVTDEIIEIF